MKTLFKYTIILLVVCFSQNSEAQLLKRLKNKISNKVETKIEQAADKAIDSLGTKKTKNENTKTKVNSKATSGSVVITHSNTYGSVNIPEVKKIKAERANDTYNFSASWWTHDADIHDGFYLSIKTQHDLRHDTNKAKNVKRTFKIPEEATLKLSYDPSLPYYKKSDDDFKRAVSDNYQTYDVSKGEVTIDVLSEETIQISFNGRVSLRKVQRPKTNSDDYSESFYEATIKGGIDGESPQFTNNTSIKVAESTTKSDENYTINQLPNNTAKPGTYLFTYETKVKVTTSEQDRSYKMSYLLNPNENYMGIMVDMNEYSDEEMAGESIIVIDEGNSHIFVDAQGMKMQMSQNMMGGQQMQNPTDQMMNYDYTKLNKTGKTKTILGAICYEYTMSDNSVKMNFWVAPDVNLPNWFIQNNDLLKGHIMEYTIESKDGIMTSETIAINDNISKMINPKDYKKMF
ncbi:DUF4412 domain-containing protein [Winogradskyella forsetii]|uniref:DUF4412 domain-containing protein n=1 Tax=Winogradskyella forsetii TaxID=2686077 RepID=UPI0015BE5801|nr:DUF4412 domain-containing protein [Winogradskyella forsetii]